MNTGLGLVVEGFVAVLLMLTIAFCIVLNKRLKKLRADEQTLKATISELITATEIAERAIAGLKLTVRDCDHSLGERLRAAERFSADMEKQISAGTEVLDKLSQIVKAARPGAPTTAAAAVTAIAPDAKATAVAAQALAARARSR